MSDIAKKVKEKIVDAKDKVADVKDKAIGSEHADDREVIYASSTKSDSTKEVRSKGTDSAVSSRYPRLWKERILKHLNLLRWRMLKKD